jgi:hypothetical protein
VNQLRVPFGQIRQVRDVDPEPADATAHHFDLDTVAAHEREVVDHREVEMIKSKPGVQIVKDDVSALA